MYDKKLIKALQAEGFDDNTFAFFVDEFRQGNKGVQSKAYQYANKYLELKDIPLGISPTEYLIEQIESYLYDEEEPQQNFQSPQNQKSNPNPKPQFTFPNDSIMNLAFNAFNQIENDDEQMMQNKANIIIAGKTGVGKSTLINATFRKELAKTGVGTPVTQNTQEITDDDLPIRIYDTVGLELTESTKQSTINEIQNLINNNQSKYQSKIHCMWYCVNSNTNRIEKPELELIASVANQNIPVILVLTQAFRDKQVKKFADEISKLNHQAEETVTLLAQDDEDFNVKAFGVEDLLDKTYELLPEEVKLSFVNAQTSIELKSKQAMGYIAFAIGATITATVVPIPTADMFLLIPIQLTMFAQITSCYGIEMSKNLITKILMIFASVAGVATAGKLIAGALFKLIPGAGSVAGTVISSGVAASTTFAFGVTYMYIMERLATGEMSVEDFDNKKSMERIKKLLKENLVNAMSIKNLGSNPVEIISTLMSLVKK